MANRNNQKAQVTAEQISEKYKFIAVRLYDPTDTDIDEDTVFFGASREEIVENLQENYGKEDLIEENWLIIPLGNDIRRLKVEYKIDYLAL